MRILERFRPIDIARELVSGVFRKEISRDYDLEVCVRRFGRIGDFKGCDLCGTVGG